MTALLECKDLCIAYGPQEAVSHVSFSLERGEIIGVAGASGSGKSTLLRAILGLPEGNARVTEGTILYDGRSLGEMPAREREALWGRDIGSIFQSPAASFNPIRTYGRQFREMLESNGCHYCLEETLAVLPKVGLPADPALLRQCPCQLSGGMNQRMAIAAMLMLSPKLLLCDEVTSALDVINQEQVVKELKVLREETGCAILFVTHHLGVASALSDKLIVLSDGKIVENGGTQTILQHAENLETRRMLRSVPSFAGPAPEARTISSEVVLEAKDICKSYRLGHKRKICAVNGVSLQVHRGEILGIVGESGCGKSTLLRQLAGLERPDRGTVTPLHCSMIFQNALGSFDPRIPVHRSILEAAKTSARRAKKPYSEPETENRLQEYLTKLGLPPSLLERTPLNLSGGQCQRMAILRAILTDPDVLLCDEATSALDVLSQQEVGELLTRLRNQFPIVFVSHDPALAYRLCDRIAVMKGGEVRETGTPRQLFQDPQDSYTKELFTPRLEVPLLKTIKQEMKTYWNSRARAWKELRIRELRSPKRDLWSAEVNRYLPKKKGLRILDIGTGTGFFTFLLTEEGQKVTGIDLTENMIAEAQVSARELDLPASFEVMDAENLDFSDESFDAIVCRNLTWTLPHLEKAYRDWYRVLRPGGVLIVFDADYNHLEETYCGCVPNGWAHNGLSKETWDSYIHMKHELAQLQNPRPEWDEQLLTKIGFKNIQTDSHLSERIYAEQDEFYNPTPMFSLSAVKGTTVERLS